MRKLLIAVLLFLGILFIFAQFAEIEKIYETVKQGQWQFIALACLIQVIWFWNVAASYYSIYRSLGIYERPEILFLLSTGANFVNVVAPSIGMGGMVVFIDQARRRGNSTGKVTVAGVLFVLFEYMGVLLLLALGMFILFRTNHLTVAEIVASGLLFLIASVLATVLYLGMYSSQLLGNILASAAGVINRILWPFTKRAYLSEDYARRFAHDSAEGLHYVRQRPRTLIWPLLLSISSKLLLMAVLYFSFRAFKTPVTLSTLVAGFSVAYLFMIISPTPSGIGFVEGALTITLSSFQVPLSAATVVTLAYRGITFWLPLLFGMFAIRKIASLQADAAMETSKTPLSQRNGV